MSFFSDEPKLPSDASLDVEQAVLERYRKGAQEIEEDLCCSADYEERFLKVIPEEIRSRDYGCGDPSRYLQPGDTVLDLGSGAGKICFIASQIVGKRGHVIGVDFNDDMLELAERHHQDIGNTIGWHNVEFRKGRIQDLSLDTRRLDTYLATNPVDSSTSLAALEAHVAMLRHQHPLVASESIDVVVSNCVLNLVSDAEKQVLFQEIFRVLRRGGRVAISDVVSDEDVPENMKRDPRLWSGCISGAFREDLFLKAFEDAGFHGIQIASRQEKPWRVVEGIEFRSLTITARKGKQGPCWERKQGIIYLGPWREVVDDDGHRLVRGQRVAVCDKTYRLLTSEPYTRQIAPVEPYHDIPLDKAKPFACKGYSLRHPKETKGKDYDITTEATEPCCGSGPDKSSSNGSSCC